MRLLVLEDDVRLSESYSTCLRVDGFAVDEVRTLREARQALVDESYDCLVLDRLVPDGDSLELVADLDRQDERAPVLMVSGALAAATDRVEGLTIGADDYVAKPVRLEELVLRVRKLTSRAVTEALPSGRVRLGRVLLDRPRREVRLDGDAVWLTPTQYAVFEYLVANRHRVVPTLELLDHCWDRNRPLFSNPSHSQVSRLRKIFRGALRIELVRGEGYIVRADEEGAPD